MITGRVIRENKTNYIVRTNAGEMTAVVRGSFHAEKDGYPKVGDRVEVLETAPGQVVIETVLPRDTVIARKAAHTDTTQILVANVDLIIIVMGLDHDFNLNRLERYVLLAQQSDIVPLIVLSKSDVPVDVDGHRALVRARFPDVPVLTLSAQTGEGVDALDTYLHTGVTAVLLGSSGAGKSTLTNRLMGTLEQKTAAVRGDDSHGRHTTTARELFVLPNGGELIDTPGMRELGLVGEVSGTDQYADIEAIMAQCRFSDCDHDKSTGCVVRAAVDAGTLDEVRLRNYTKLLHERAYLQSKMDEDHDRRYREGQRTLHKKYRTILRGKHEERARWEE